MRTQNDEGRLAKLDLKKTVVDITMPLASQFSALCLLASTAFSAFLRSASRTDKFCDFQYDVIPLHLPEALAVLYDDARMRGMTRCQ